MKNSAMLRDKTISVTITQDEYDKLKSAADKDERPVSTYARRLILTALDSAPSGSWTQSNLRSGPAPVHPVADGLSG